MWVASVVHLTDMHLYLDVNGRVYRPVDRAAETEFLLRVAHLTDSIWWRNLFVGISEHNPKALRRLKTRLPEILAEERQEAVRVHGDDLGRQLPIVVVQTGDVEAYGARVLPGGMYRFPGWDHLHMAVENLLVQADDTGQHAWIDVFGNHDVWGGAYPLVRPQGHRAVLKEEIAKVPGLEGPWPERYQHVFPLPGGRTLEVYRASTVPDGWLSGLRASAALTPHPLGRLLPLTGSGDASRELILVAEAKYDPRAIRLLLLHHPIHAFEAGVFKRWLATAAFKRRRRVAKIVGRVPFHLVVAGHRHALHPPEGATYNATHMRQPPLPRGVGQIVAESPTAVPMAFDDVAAPEPFSYSFSLYRLLLDEKRGVMDITRCVFRYTDGTDQPFRCSGLETVLTDLGLE